MEKEIKEAYQLIGSRIGKIRWEGTTKKDRSEYMKKIGEIGRKSRWDKINKKDRSIYMKKLSLMRPGCHQKNKIIKDDITNI